MPNSLWNFRSSLSVVAKLTAKQQAPLNLKNQALLISRLFRARTKVRYYGIFFLGLLVTFLVFRVSPVRAFTTDSTTLPEPLQNHASVSVDLPGPNERVYVIGGFNGSNQASNKIYSIKVNNDSTLDGQGGWRQEAQLPQALAFPGVTLIDPGSGSDKTLYVIGGEAGNGAGINPSNVVYKATIDKSTGVVSTFTQLNSSVQKLDPTTGEPLPGQYEPITLPKKLYGHSVVSATISSQLPATSYIYILGGAMPEGHTTIYRATLDSSYNLVNQNTTEPSSAFQPLSTTLPVPLIHHQASVITKDPSTGSGLANPVIVVTGGLITSGVSDKIYTTKINSDGTLTNFTQETLTLPEQVFFHSQDVNPTDGTLIITGGKKQDRTTRGESKVDKLLKLSLNSSGNVQSLDDLTGGIGEALEGPTVKITKSGKTILLGGQKETIETINGRRTIKSSLDPKARTDTVDSIKTRGRLASYQLPETGYQLKSNSYQLKAKSFVSSIAYLLKAVSYKLKAFLAPPVQATHTPSDGDKNYTVNTTVSAGSTNNFDAVTVYDAVTPAAVTLTLSNTSAITFNTHAWTIGNGSTTAGTINFTGTATVTISASSNTITLSGTGGIGNITHTAGTDTASPWTTDYYVNLNITGNLTVASGGTINVNGKGYPGAPPTTAGRGSGGSVVGGVAIGGAGYGGTGGASGGSGTSSSAGGLTYGSLTAPDDAGSSGGAHNDVTGGAGGGLINLTISGTSTVNGTISANGGNGQAATWTSSGGGSGGGIYISTGTLADSSGSITANGGNGATANGDRHSGGGAGGRIAISYTTDNDSGSPITKTAYGGTSNNQYGAAGTVYMTTAGGASRTLTVDNNSQTNPGTPIPSSTTWTVDTLNVNNAGDLRIPSGTTLTFSSSGSVASSGSSTYIRMSGGTLTPPNAFTIPSPIIFIYTSGTLNSPSTSLTVASGATIQQDTTTQISLTTNVIIAGDLTHSANTSSLAYEVDLNVTGDLTVSGTVNVNSKGYTAGNGTGANGQAGLGGSGSGYGGNGGSGQDQNGTYTGGTTYGSLTSPADLGSGGKNSNGNESAGGTGGGLIKLVVSGTTTISGTVSVNGGNGASGAPWTAGGGGSGGEYISLLGL